MVMAGVTWFEDLIAWQKARMLTRSLYHTTRQEPVAHDFGLINQMRRAAVSVMSNIAEGFDRSRATEFHHYLSIAKASCAEVRSQLYVALDVSYISQQQFDDLNALALEVYRLVSALRTAVQKRRDNSPEH
jgi:four helix bundle protein